MDEPIKISGIVKSHSKRGRKLGFPTANIDILQGIADGIYVGFCHYEGVANPALIFVGAPVTFDDPRRRAEVYLLDFDDDLYDEEVEVELVKKLRDNIKFNSSQELVAKMQEDEKEAREYFGLTDDADGIKINYYE